VVNAQQQTCIAAFQAVVESRKRLDPVEAGFEISANGNRASALWELGVSLVSAANMLAWHRQWDTVSAILQTGMLPFVDAKTDSALCVTVLQFADGSEASTAAASLLLESRAGIADVSDVGVFAAAHLPFDSQTWQTIFSNYAKQKGFFVALLSELPRIDPSSQRITVVFERLSAWLSGPAKSARTKMVFRDLSGSAYNGKRFLGELALSNAELTRAVLAQICSWAHCQAQLDAFKKGQTDVLPRPGLFALDAAAKSSLLTLFQSATEDWCVDAYRLLFQMGACAPIEAEALYNELSLDAGRKRALTPIRESVMALQALSSSAPRKLKFVGQQTDGAKRLSRL